MPILAFGTVLAISPPLYRAALALLHRIPRIVATSVFLVFLIFTSLGSLVLCEIKPAGAQERKQRVLMLYPYNNLFLASIVAGEAARKRLTERAGDALELYTDFLDLSRFAQQPHEVRTTSYLAEKYHDRKPDLVMALGAQALEFVLKNRQKL